MKFLFQVALTILLSYVTAQFLPWWSLVVCAALVATGLSPNRTTAFLGGFVAISLLWMVTATVIDVRTDSILSTKIAALLGFPSPIWLVLLTGLLGGIMGGLGALSGQQVRTLLTHKAPKKISRRY